MARRNDADTMNTRCEKQLKEHQSCPTVGEKAGLVEANIFWDRHDALDIAFPLLTDLQNYRVSSLKNSMQPVLEFHVKCYVM